MLLLHPVKELSQTQEGNEVLGAFAIAQPLQVFAKITSIDSSCVLFFIGKCFIRFVTAFLISPLYSFVGTRNAGVACLIKSPFTGFISHFLACF
jgi:hypothetical protein